MSKGKRKICVVTGTRAEYGLLQCLMEEIRDDDELELQLIVTGMHLSPEFGLTYKVIEADGSVIDEKVEMLLSSDTPVGIAKSMGLATIGFADALARLQPDIVVVLGDRYEILAAAQAALVLKIPLAHLAGGDVTQGAYDESIRHGITKMAHLHFPTNAVSAKRIAQLGECPQNIFDCGFTGIDSIKRVKLLGRQELEGSLDFAFQAKNALVTFHPTTLDLDAVSHQIEEVLSAFDAECPAWGLIFTKANSDDGGRAVNTLLEKYVATNPRARVYASLGQQKYYSVMSQVDVVIGNSSSGIYEAPSFRKPTINIGDRQRGRLAGNSVFHASPDIESISCAIRQALAFKTETTENPYGKGGASKRICQVLKEYGNYTGLLKKTFYDVEFIDG